MALDLPPRLYGYPVAVAAWPPLHVLTATTVRARLLGLAGLRTLPDGVGLLLPATCSVHTFGMRFALDLIWLDSDGNVARIDQAVPPNRVRTCRRARGVVELAAGGAERGEPGRRPGSRLGAVRDPAPRSAGSGSRCRGRRRSTS